MFNKKINNYNNSISIMRVRSRILNFDENKDFTRCRTGNTKIHILIAKIVWFSIAHSFKF